MGVANPNYDILRTANIIYRSGCIYFEIGSVSDFVELTVQTILAYPANYFVTEAGNTYVAGHHIVDIFFRDHLWTSHEVTAEVEARLDEVNRKIDEVIDEFDTAAEMADLDDYSDSDDDLFGSDDE